MRRIETWLEAEEEVNGEIKFGFVCSCCEAWSDTNEETCPSCGAKMKMVDE